MIKAVCFDLDNTLPGQGWISPFLPGGSIRTAEYVSSDE